MFCLLVSFFLSFSFVSFVKVEGDHITMLNIYNSFLNNQRDAAGWCKRFFLNHRTLSRAVEVRRQIRGFLVRFGIPMKSSTSPTVLDDLRKCVIHGLFANTAQLQPDGTYRSLRGSQALAVHPSSSLFRGTLPQWVVYGEMIYTSKAFINQVTPVEAAWLAKIAPAYFEIK